MKYEKLNAEIIEFGENEFMAGSWNGSSCSDYTNTGKWGATHSCSLVTGGGNDFQCGGHTCSGYTACTFHRQPCNSWGFTCFGYA